MTVDVESLYQSVTIKLRSLAREGWKPGMLRVFSRFRISKGAGQQAAETISIQDMKARTLDAFGAPVFIMSNGEIIFANDACCKAFGTTAANDIVGRHITDLLGDIQPDGLPWRQSLNLFNIDFKAKGFVRRMWSIKRLDGSMMVVRSTIAKIAHPTFRCSVSVFEDLDAFAAEHTLQQKAVRALSQNGTVKTVADGVTETARALTTEARSLARASEQATALLRQVVVSAETSTASTSSILDSTNEMSTNIERVTSRMSDREGRAREATVIAAQVCETISSLNVAAQRIGDVVGLVGSFASQTQLLALNATIEAARAGEAGRAFSVVAAEVKALAVQSEKASAGVRQQISGIQGMVQVAVAAIGEISRSVECLRQDTIDLAEDIRMQQDSTHMIIRNVQQSAKAAQALDDNVHRLFSVVSENTVMSGKLLDGSTLLTAEADCLQREVREYSSTA